MRRFGLLVILLFFLAIPVFGQGVGEAWVARYNGLANHSDQASDLALDQYGNVYVTGFSLGSGFNDDYATIKYSANGDTLWLRRYNGP